MCVAGETPTAFRSSNSENHLESGRPKGVFPSFFFFGVIVTSKKAAGSRRSGFITENTQVDIPKMEKKKMLPVRLKTARTEPCLSNKELIKSELLHVKEKGTLNPQ